MPYYALAKFPWLWGDPIGRRRLLAIRSALAHREVNLNHHLMNFSRHHERGDSKWDLDSHNVPYGIFSVTLKSVPTTDLTIASRSSSVRFVLR
jgi:hypothetical protein